MSAKCCGFYPAPHTAQLFTVLSHRRNLFLAYIICSQDQNCNSFSWKRRNFLAAFSQALFGFSSGLPRIHVHRFHPHLDTLNHTGSLFRYVSANSLPDLLQKLIFMDSPQLTAVTPAPLMAVSANPCHLSPPYPNNVRLVIGLPHSSQNTFPNRK